MNKMHTHYHKDGSMWAKGILNGKTMDGYWEWFRKDGTKMRSGNFLKGKQVGVWITYTSKGSIVKVTDMDAKKKPAKKKPATKRSTRR